MHGLVRCSSLWLLFTSGECFFSSLLFMYICICKINKSFFILYLRQTVFINYKLIIRSFYCACANYRFFKSHYIYIMNCHKTLIPENFMEIGQKLKELEQFMYFALIWGVPTLIQKSKNSHV